LSQWCSSVATTALLLLASVLQGGAKNLLHALQKRDRLRAACMQIQLTAADDDLSQQLLENSAAAENVSVLQVIFSKLCMPCTVCAVQTLHNAPIPNSWLDRCVC
jgi:hypothetical protein